MKAIFTFLFLVMALLGPLSSAEAKRRPGSKKKYSGNIVGKSISHSNKKKHMEFTIEAMNSGSPSGSSAFSGRVALIFRAFRLDAALTIGLMKYGDIKAIKSNTDTADIDSGFESPDAEINRVRSDSDDWSMQFFDVGIGTSMKTFSFLGKKFYDVVRFSIGTGFMDDNAKQINFMGYLGGVEWQLRYDLSKSRASSVGIGTKFNWGIAIADGDGIQDARTLPLDLWTFTASYSFAF